MEIKFLSGLKTYLIAVAMIVWAFIGLKMGVLEQSQTIDIFFKGLALIGIRSAIARLETK